MNVLWFLGCWLPVACSCLYCLLVAFAARAAPLVTGRHQHSHWAVFAGQLVVWHVTVSEPALG
eukprot:1957459-Rhodomonas_salina.1